MVKNDVKMSIIASFPTISNGNIQNPRSFHWFPQEICTFQRKSSPTRCGLSKNFHPKDRAALYWYREAPKGFKKIQTPKGRRTDGYAEPGPEKYGKLILQRLMGYYSFPVVATQKIFEDFYPGSLRKFDPI